MTSPYIKPTVAKIKGLAQEIKALRKDKSNLKQFERYLLSYDARHLLLAYAFVRGVSYKRIEAKCNEMPSADIIARAALFIGWRAEKLKRPKTFRGSHSLVVWRQVLPDLQHCINEVERWLELPTPALKVIAEPTHKEKQRNVIDKVIDTLYYWIGIQ